MLKKNVNKVLWNYKIKTLLVDNLHKSQTELFKAVLMPSSIKNTEKQSRTQSTQHKAQHQSLAS